MITSEYAAGLFDGEGHVHMHAYDLTKRTDLKSPNALVYARIGIRENEVLQTFKAKYGGALSCARQATDKWAAYYEWSANGQTALHFLKDVEPHLLIKKAQAQTALEYRVFKNQHWHTCSFTERQRRIDDTTAKLRQLNRKGPTRQWQRVAA